MAKDGNANGSATMRLAAGALFAVIIVVLGAQLSDAKDVRSMVSISAQANARQDATISSIYETTRRIEHNIDRIFEILRKSRGVPESP